MGQHGSTQRVQRESTSSVSSRTPQIRCYNCQGIFTTTQPGQLHHVRCPYCSTINGVPNGSGSAGSPLSQLQAASASSSSGGELSTASLVRQEQLLRRLQAREITPLELLILREFVQHLQDNRTGASSSEIDNHTVDGSGRTNRPPIFLLRVFQWPHVPLVVTLDTCVSQASWVVDDVIKLPEELRSCCVCLEDVCCGNKVRTLPCLHTFHADCAEEWLKKKKVCPLCQFAIDDTGEEPAEAST